MGMFDYVEFKAACPNCGQEVDGFQSKDGPCMLLTLKPWEVSDFYTGCRKCDHWVEFRKILPEDSPGYVHQSPPESPNWFDHYKAVTTPIKKKFGIEK